MGTKSFSRRQRDAFASKNTGWDELQRLYVNNQSQLNDLIRSTTDFFNEPDTRDMMTLDERIQAARAIRTLSTDVKNFQARLTNIYAQHKHFNGRIKVGNFSKDKDVGESFEEYNKAVAIFDAYATYVSDYKRIVSPVHQDVLALMTTLGQRAATIMQQEAAQEDQPQE